MDKKKNIKYNSNNNTIIETKVRELDETEFFCKECNTVHKKSPYAIAQKAMGVDLIFTCDCGNKVDLFA